MEKYTKPVNYKLADTPDYNILKNAITQQFGKRVITAKECLELADDIYDKTSQKISLSTLRRFFGLVETGYPPSETTVTILSRYCGFSLFQQLVGVKTNTVVEDVTYDKRLVQYLIKLFRDVNIEHNSDTTFFSFAALTIKHINKQPGLLAEFQRAIVRTQNGRNFYFEQFVNIDRLNTFYGDGVLLYIGEVKEPEKKILGYAMLYLRYWLTDNIELALEQFSYIKKIKNFKKAPHLCGWYFATLLLHAELHGIAHDSICKQAYEDHLHFKKKHTKVHESFELPYCRALILTGHFEDAKYYVNYLLGCYTEDNQLRSLDFYETLLLFKVIVLSKTGEADRAKYIFETIKPAEFNFLSKQTDTILYLLLAKYLGQSGYTNQEQLADLLAATGFLKLKRYMLFL